MNRIVSIVLAILLAVTVTFAIRAHWEIGERDQELESLRRKLNADHPQPVAADKAIDSELATLREDVARLKRERDAALAKAKEPGVSAPAVAVEAGAPAKEEDNPLKGFAKMFEGEEGKKMMKAQAEMGTRMMYGDLKRALGLSQADSDMVMTLLAERQSALTEDSFGLLSGDFDEAKMKGLEEKSKAVSEEYDKKLKAVLGEEKFAQMQDFEKTIGDRMMMSQYEQQFSSAGVPLQPEQRDGLLKIMAEERKKSPEAPFDQTGRDPVKGFNALKDEGAMEKWITQEEDYQRRVLAAAPGTLSPDQVSALQKALSQNMEMQKFGMKMGQQMLKGAKDGGVKVDVAPPIVVPQ